MPVCRLCGKEFHHCSSCGDDGHSEYDFCSYTCLNILRHGYDMFINCLLNRVGHPELYDKIFESLTDGSFGYLDEED
jgi:hypothetical protein